MTPKNNKSNPLNLDVFLSLGFSMDEANILLKNEQKKRAAAFSENTPNPVRSTKPGVNYRTH